MPLPANLTNHKALDIYYAAIATYQTQDVAHEQATRLAFSTLLDTLSKTVGWTVVLEKRLSNRKRLFRTCRGKRMFSDLVLAHYKAMHQKRLAANLVEKRGELFQVFLMQSMLFCCPASPEEPRKIPDATLQDSFKIPRGHWEAKDTNDDLDTEIKTKIARGYPLTNIIFEDTRRAVLYQNGRPAFEADLKQRSQLVALLTKFLTYTGEQIEEFHLAVQKFKDDIPELAHGLMGRIDDERGQNKRFVAAFDAFQQICRASIDPDISVAEIEEMLVQHLLTERLFRTVFDDPDFTDRNVIAVEIEKVIKALTSRSFNRSAFLKSLDYFYVAIEEAARTINDYTQKQTFLNTVYERFFQGFSKGQADTHGVVYTPQPIVDFMINSVDEVLQKEFGLSLSSEGVKILDPATGTGNFIVNILRKINRRDLKRKYHDELFANEIMLLPYYIASLNIEHAYFDLAGEYEAFEGICFTDTLELAESQQLSLFAEENTERVQRQKNAEITVIIGNPPYNLGQQSENENNKNRRYKIVDQRIRETYGKDSRATLNTKLYDAYVKFFRWACDRLRGRDGIVCFVSNNSFVEDFPFDGMRQNLQNDFNQIYHLDLHGNVRKNPKLSGTTHNVFGIQVGVGITIAVRNSLNLEKTLHYTRVPGDWTRTEKLAFLADNKTISAIDWQISRSDKHYNWITEKLRADFSSFVSIGTKETKAEISRDVKAIFKTYSLGVATNRDEWMYDFIRDNIARKVQLFIKNYNYEVFRYSQLQSKPSNIDDFVNNESPFLKWTDRLKDELQKQHTLQFEEVRIRQSIYRPFCQQYLYFDHLLNQRRYQQHHFFPSRESEVENTAIVVTSHSQVPFSCQMMNVIPSLDVGGRPSQCFPFYTYAEDGSNRRENITDWSVTQFQAQYGAQVTKRDIFHYVYCVLHSPQYRERYAENLKRELPRIPFVAKDAWQTFVDTGARLADIHLNYEQAKEYPLQWIENKDVSFSWRVTKMQLSKDKTQLKVNESLTLTGIPAECFEYRLGNRSALDWVIDQYQVSTDKRSGITSDPNRADDEEYIVRLVGRVIAVSMETVKLVKALPPVVVVEEVVS